MSPSFARPRYTLDAAARLAENAKRCQAAEAALKAHAKARGQSDTDPASQIQDLITDLFHWLGHEWAGAGSRLSSEDIGDILGRATGHYHAEDTL